MDSAQLLELIERHLAAIENEVRVQTRLLRALSDKDEPCPHCGGTEGEDTTAFGEPEQWTCSSCGRTSRRGDA